MASVPLSHEGFMSLGKKTQENRWTLRKQAERLFLGYFLAYLVVFYYFCIRSYNCSL